jgi:hypothetical protein
MADRVEDRGFHQRQGNRGCHLEHLPLVGGVALHIVVVRIDRQLLLGAGDEHAGARHDQRPERLQLRFVEGKPFLEGANRRQDKERVAIGMMQQRGAGDGEVGDQPAGDNIAKIDDAVRHEAAFPVGPGDHVVVGDVVMDRLHPQLAGERLDALDCRHHGLGDPVALRMVRHGLQ